VIATAQLMVVLDATIVNVALPHIQNALHFSGTNLEWVVNAYTLAFGGLLLLGGRSGDLLGRRRIFIFGILLFSAASLLGGFATDQAGCSAPAPCRASAARSPRPPRCR
jgi:MFS family permease